MSKLERVNTVRCPPGLEARARATWDAIHFIVDPSMPEGRIEVTPLAYAEKIDMTIGFHNPDGANDAIEYYLPCQNPGERPN